MNTPVGSITCISCGYDVTGLHEAGSCPECAGSVAQSRAASLRLAPPSFRRQLSWARRLIAASLPLYLISSAFTCLGALYLNGWVSITFDFLMNCAVLLDWPAPLAPLLLLTGLWCLTGRDSPAVETRPSKLTRIALRWVIAVSAALAMVGVANAWMPHSASLPDWLTLPFRFLRSTAKAAMFILASGYLLHLSRRATDGSLRRMAWHSRWLIPLLIVPPLVPWAFLLGLPGYSSPARSVPAQMARAAILVTPQMGQFIAVLLIYLITRGLARAARPTAPSGTS